MNNTATHSSTNNTPCQTVRKQISKATCIVRVHFSQTAKETMKSAKCDFFLNLMKKSLTFRLWRRCLKGFLQSLFPENNGPEYPASPRPARPSGAHPIG